MDPENQAQIQAIAEAEGTENTLVVLGAVDVEALEVAGETVTRGDPAFVGPLAGVQLGLPVFHIVEDEILRLKPIREQVWEEQDAPARQEAEGLIYAAAKTVNELAGVIPELVIATGRPPEALLELIKSDKDISILVLAAGVSKEGPGPLVSLFTTGVQAIPVTIVPGNFTEDKIDQLA